MIQEVKHNADKEAQELRKEISSRLNNLTAKQLQEFIAEVERLLVKSPKGTTHN